MSLNYNLSATALPRDDNGLILWTTATEWLIFATMSTGIGAITEATAPEFFARLETLQSMDNTVPDGRINAADVKQHIGLTTNVSPMTRAQWLKRIVGGRVDREAASFATRADASTPRPQRLN